MALSAKRPKPRELTVTLKFTEKEWEFLDSTIELSSLALAEQMSEDLMKLAQKVRKQLDSAAALARKRERMSEDRLQSGYEKMHLDACKD